MSFKVKQYEFKCGNGEEIIFELDTSVFSLLVLDDDLKYEIVATFDKEDIQELITLLDYINTELNG